MNTPTPSLLTTDEWRGAYKALEAQRDEAIADKAALFKIYEQRCKEVDEALKKVDRLSEAFGSIDKDCFEQVINQRDEALKDVEQLRVQLAGCGVAAMQNTEDSKQHRAVQGDYGYSASYAEVCRAVDREIALRAERDEALTLLSEVFDAWENGVACYEDPEDFANYIGTAFKLDDSVFTRCCDLLNRTNPPRNASTSIRTIEAQRDEALDEIEQLRVQLAGCGVAAMQNTEDSKQHRAVQGDYGYSESYAEVCRAVDREIALRAERNAALAEIERLKCACASYEKQANSDWLKQHDDEALLREALEYIDYMGAAGGELSTKIKERLGETK